MKLRIIGGQVFVAMGFDMIYISNELFGKLQ